MMDIGQAIEAVKDGERVTRQGWNGKDMFIFLVPDSPDHRAHVDMRTVDGAIVPWTCSQSDLLAQDWELVEQESRPQPTPESASALEPEPVPPPPPPPPPPLPPPPPEPEPAPKRRPSSASGYHDRIPRAGRGRDKR